MVWAVFAEDWKQGIEAAAHTGNSTVISGYLAITSKNPQTGSEDFPLGLWLAGKREQRKTMTPKRIAELDALGIAWRPYEDTWRRNFEAAQAYYARHGNLDMPARYVEHLPKGEVDLGAWLYRQHAEMEAGTLSAERSAALESLGVQLVRAHERAWQHALTFARLYHNKFGNLNVQAQQTITDADGEEFRLGAWISKDTGSPDSRNSRQPIEYQSWTARDDLGCKRSRVA